MTTVLKAKSTPLSMPKAAPVLWTRVRLSRLGTTSMLSCRARALLTSTFVIWSSTTTVTTMISSSCRSRSRPIMRARRGPARPRSAGTAPRFPRRG